MVDTHRMAELMRLADQHGCSLRLVGDPAPLSAIDFVPDAGALATTHYAMHEWIGIAWYWLRHARSASLAQAKA